MAGWFADLIATAFGACSEAAQRSTLLDVNGFNLQLVDIGTIVVFCIGDGRLQNFLDDHSSFFLRELQNVQGLVYLLATNQVSDQTTFVDRQSNATKACFGFHGLFLTSSRLFYQPDDL